MKAKLKNLDEMLDIFIKKDCAIWPIFAKNAGKTVDIDIEGTQCHLPNHQGPRKEFTEDVVDYFIHNFKKDQIVEVSDMSDFSTSRLAIYGYFDKSYYVILKPGSNKIASYRYARKVKGVSL